MRPQIGYTHGSQATSQVKSSIHFYDRLFEKTAAMDWKTVKKTALEFEPHINANWPSLLEEMQGGLHQNALSGRGSP